MTLISMDSGLTHSRTNLALVACCAAASLVWSMAEEG